MKKQVPNIITLLNLLSGIVAIYSILSLKNLQLGALFIIIGAVFDFFDGMMARLLCVSSPIGKELDSLSDVITFGVAPSFIAMSLLQNEFGTNFITFVPLFMAMMSSFRLAKFNLDARQTTSFIGLPTPANALIWLSIPLVGFLSENGVSVWFISGDNGRFFACLYSILSSSYFILPICLICSWLLVSEIPMFSLKFHDLKWQNNRLRFTFLLISLVFLLLLYFAAVPFIIIMYIILSIIDNKKS